MSKINKAIYEIHEMDEMADKNTNINRIHPLVKLILTVVYITCVVSFDKYDIFGLLPMLLYPLIIFNLAEISIKSCFKKLRVVLPLVCFVGLFNPLFDHTPLLHIGGVVITGGVISMLTLVIKGIYTLVATYLLVATTGIEKICYALRLLHIPGIIVTQILLVYRYITLLMGEANAVIEAYSMRAPNQKGVKYKIWGSLIGQLLLRSIDRAENIFDSMLLRGFNGEFYYSDRRRCTQTDYIYLFLWLGIIVGLRIVNIAGIIAVLL
ncbi:cobalt ECF transporter T component CbiQ [Parasporobacterium paucivorans]|uniref:Cobalt/nickel transport system permease protein n=1 Tax=Parasporobacterium paucivorans DSM 15970 TaxID=1122934 RepID=A0A1M6A8Y3_9FIRM|nr:cobalt ECF transporter T component CbiQ [Parasporobacterium paucivorans]SHI32573.1 cobalt/nickel transport system permease protein [Parasporobacterium paucivorans DSM 15970]